MSSKILFGDIAKFSNGKSSPDRDEKAKFNVYGSNGIIGKSDETNAKEETIIIGRVGSYCGSVYFSKDKCWVTDNAIKCEAKDNNVPSFIYYQALVLNLNNFRVGSGQPLLNQGILNNLEINYIKPKQQQKIAHILSTLDDKIELNRKMNQTLEEMASAIFKSWFVDFDPVHVKLTCKDEEELENAAKELGISKEILDLFPSEFEESELGMIPKGWEVKKAGEITNTFDYVANGSFASLKENVTLYDEPNDILYVRTTDFNNGFKGSLKYTDKKSYEFLKKSKLLGHETVISNVADVGTVFRAPVWLGLPMTLGSNAIGVVGLDNEFLDSYIFYFFKSNIGQHLIESITTGSAQLKFNKTSFRALNILLPNIEIRKIFEKQEKLIYEKMINNIAEIQTLQKTRDTLLPKLLSGEIDVSEVEV